MRTDPHYGNPLQIRHKVSLQEFNTMGVPALATHFTTVASAAELQQALQFAKAERLPHLILGGGSNILFKQDYQGLVIHMQCKGIKLGAESSGHTMVTVAAGENWHRLVEKCVHNGWHGLENLALIPGSVGAAPMQNIGAYGVELKDTLHTVEYFDSVDHAFHQLNNADCQFAYRDSIFKHELAGRAVVTRVTFRLDRQFSPVLTYAELDKALKTRREPSAQTVFDAVCALRNKKLPLPSALPNSGSFFKNPVVGHGQLAEIKAQYPDIVSFTDGDKVKLAAAWLIEQAGWKRRQHDGVRVHRNQALVITNPRRRPGTSVLALAKKIQDDIKRKFNVDLELEPRVY